MGFKAFLRQNAKQAENTKIAVSDRFCMEDGSVALWELRAISEHENARLKDDCTSTSIGKGGRPHTRFDGALYNKRLIAASVVDPDLMNAELQASYGVVGEIALLDELLIAGEYALLQETVQQANGFSLEKLEAQKEEVKNS